ncbi:hypothetical protein OHB12_04595 [Nocardia sp. NBC_01730]|uniref:hypothetical protein n=1 Tax=Nocardia sp. NBC_01730 TaxID=2975998 RepID=UPI002E113A48|nr:hypothetical protein OHB12_04595 [Nocardia sp. NBC_01730]
MSNLPQFHFIRAVLRRRPAKAYETAIRELRRRYDEGDPEVLACFVASSPVFAA